MEPAGLGGQRVEARSVLDKRVVEPVHEIFQRAKTLMRLRLRDLRCKVNDSGELTRRLKGFIESPPREAVAQELIERCDLLVWNGGAAREIPGFTRDS